MTRGRIIHEAPFDRARRDYRRQHGRYPKVCRWCGGPVPSGRFTFCGQACVDQYTVRSSPTDARRQVLGRDHGVCAQCGLDCWALEREIRKILCDHGTAARRAWLRWQGLERYGSKSLWAADHIVPVSEGGGGCGLDGYRTLCVLCHKAETKALKGRLAAALRPLPGGTK